MVAVIVNEHSRVTCLSWEPLLLFSFRNKCTLAAVSAQLCCFFPSSNKVHRKIISSSYLIRLSPSQTVQVRQYRRFGAQVSSIPRSDKLYDRLCVLSSSRLRPLLVCSLPLWRCALLGWRWGNSSLWGDTGINGTAKKNPNCFPKYGLGTCGGPYQKSFQL